MIRLFLSALIALGLGAALALLLAEDPGYVLVAVRGYTVEATLGAVALGLLAALVLGFAAVWLLRLLNPLRWLRGGFGQGAARRNAANTSAEGLQLLLLGRWEDSYRKLVASAERVDNPTFNYLAAAIAAFKRGDELGWNWCLEQAEKKARGGVHGLRSLRALMETRGGRFEQGLARLSSLQRLAPGSPFVLEQLKDCYLQVGDWSGLAALLPELKKRQVLDADTLHALSVRVWQQRLQIAVDEGLHSLHRCWQELPKPLRQEESLAGQYLQHLLYLGEEEEASALLGRQLKHAWSDNLINMLGLVPMHDPQQQLLQLEGWLKERPNDAALLLTLGRLSLRNQQWTKAREYFEHALRYATSVALTAEISAELGRLLENLGEDEESLSCYQRAMALLEHKLPELPQPLRVEEIARPG